MAVFSEPLVILTDKDKDIYEVLRKTLADKGLSFDFHISREKEGKPFFTYNDRIHFSVSDTTDCKALIICDRRCGIDIEHLRKHKQDVARRFFHPEEYRYLQQFSDNEDLYDKAFTQLWTIKESYVKMTGRGIAGEFSAINMAPPSFALSQQHFVNGHRIFSSYDQDRDLFLSWCIK